MDFNQVVVFVKVVQAGSFSAAARLLGLPTSTVRISPSARSLSSMLSSFFVISAFTKSSVTLSSPAVKLLPPMPSHNLAKMSDPDLRAIYRYVHSLGAAGQPEPENLPPGVEPKTPVEDMVPVPPKA